MLKIKAIHHVAIICADYEKSKDFYVNKLGLKILAEHFRENRQSFKLDLAVDDQYQIELFSFPNCPPRQTNPEAQGLRHLAFLVENIDDAILELQRQDIVVESCRIDEYTGKKFTFFRDPDDLPLELYQE
jgi:glyoxylase I family protein